jgi:prolipoprotein diacylglyceryltransferase
MTMGMLLSVPLFIAGIGFVTYALRRPALGDKSA